MGGIGTIDFQRLGAAFSADDALEFAGEFRNEMFGTIAEAEADERGH